MNQTLGRRFRLALHAITAQRMHRLRRQPEVTANRNAARGQKVYGLGHALATLELDHLRAGRHQLGGIGKRLRRTGLIGSPRHIADNKSALRSACNTGGVIDGVALRHRQCGVMPLHHHAKRIANQYGVDTSRINHRGETRIVGRQHRDTFAVLLHFLQCCQRDSHLYSPILKNSRVPRIAIIRSISRSKSAGVSTKLRCSELTINTGASSYW